MEATGRKVFAFLIGCFVYSLIEISSRGYTHWTMTLTGGIILALLFDMFTHLRSIPLWQKWLLGALLITSVEFTVGVIVNIILDWNVWDYSAMPFNILGQVCLPFTAIWFFLCIPAGYVCSLINRRLT